MAENAVKSKILVIDDEQGPRESLRILLKVDYEVYCAASVDEGLLYMQHDRPDLIIMDIRMPERSGIDGLREIRRIDPMVAVVMLTGYATLATAQDALRLGANDYLKKPFDVADFSRAVRDNVKRTQLARQRVRTELELQELIRDLSQQLAAQEKLAVLGQKSMELVHDINNPLMTISGYAELLLLQFQQSRNKMGREYDESAEFMDAITKSVARCKDMIALWRSQYKPQPPARSLVSLTAMLKDIVQALQPQAREKGGQVEFVSDAAPCEVMADNIEIFRALQNVVTNAIHALKGPGGRVGVSCRPQGAQVEICVEDNGCGIPPENLRTIFEPYYTTKVADKGLGLGLFITRKVIENHHGAIEVKSQVGEGTRMIIRLPLPAKHPSA